MLPTHSVCMHPNLRYYLCWVFLLWCWQEVELRAHACNAYRRNSRTPSSLFSARNQTVNVFLNSNQFDTLHYIYINTGLTLAVASMFSGSTSVLSNPINCTAPPNSGSVSQIMCSMIRFINRMSCKIETSHEDNR